MDLKQYLIASLSALIMVLNTNSVAGQSTVSLRLYNAIVEIEEVKGIVNPAFEYNLFEDLAMTVHVDRSARIDINETQKNLEITDNGESGIVYVRLRIPSRTMIKVDIVREGRIEARNVQADMDLKLYSGEINLESIVGGVSIISVRDAEVHLDQRMIQAIESPIFVSSYSGKIETLFNSESSFDLFLSTELGAIESNMAIEFEKDLNSPFEVKSESGTVLEYPTLAEHIVNEGGATVSIRTILGDVSILK